MYKLIILLSFSLALTACGYKHEEGVLKQGTLIDYRSFVPKRNHQAVTFINGEKVAVQGWKISYIDANGKFGACDYFTPSGGGSLEVNSLVSCSETTLEFN